MDPLLIDVAALCLAAAAAGALGGAAAGALRVGGGLLMAPAFYFLLRDFGFDGAGLPHLAVSSAAGVLGALSARAALAHIRSGVLDGELAVVGARWAVAALVGGALGGLVACALPDRWLAGAWGGFLCAAALFVALDGGAGRIRLGQATGAVASLVLGAVAGGTGIGAGALGAPLFRRAGFSEADVAALTAALGAAGSVAGAVALGLAGPPAPAPLSVGALCLPAVIIGAVAAVLAAPHGSRMAASAPGLVRLLAAFVAAVAGLAMLAGALRM